MDDQQDVPQLPVFGDETKLVAVERTIRIGPAQPMLVDHPLQVVFFNKFRPLFLPFHLLPHVSRQILKSLIRKRNRHVFFYNQHGRSRRFEDRLVPAVGGTQGFFGELAFRNVAGDALESGHIAVFVQQRNDA